MKTTQVGCSMLVATLVSLACSDLLGGEAADAPATIALTYRCEVPDGLAPQIVLHEKDGSQRSADAHAIYRHSHEDGWFWVVHGYIESNGRFPKDPPSMQEWGIMTAARNIGILEATAAITKLELVHDRSMVAAALKKQFPVWQDGLLPHPAKPAEQRRSAEPRRP